MRLLLRNLLICWMVLALPAQGMAAATLLLCGPGHHRLPQAASHHADPSAHSHEPHHGSEASSHEPASADAAGPLTGPSGSKCSACASCCTAIALPNTVPEFITVDDASKAIASPAMSVFGFVTDVPERPPRPFLA